MTAPIVRQYPNAVHYVGTIAHGADILMALEEFCKARKITMGWVSLLGAVSEVTLAYYEQEGHRYVQKHFTGEFEILNGTGNISLKGDTPIGHLHLTLSNTEFGCIGGHVIKGKSKVFACEFHIMALTGDEPLLRGDADPVTGLPLWLPH